MLKPQDLLVALHIAVHGKRTRYAEIAQDLRFGVSVAHRSVSRAKEAQLVTSEGLPHRQNITEFMIHGARFAFFTHVAGPSRGVPTGASAPGLRDMLTAKSTLVWPSSAGRMRGDSVEPIYPTVPEIVADFPRLYEVLAALDLLRVGSARERSVATDVIHNALLSKT